MSNAGHEPTHRPLPDCTFDPLGYILGVQFQAPVKLVRQGGMEFGKKLSEHIEPHGVELQDNAWTFSQPLGDRPGGLLETRYEFILDEFRKTFKPAYVIATMAKVVGTVEVDGDARRFLFEHVAHIPELRLEALGRPVHIVGIRLGMPAFQAAEPPKGKRKKPKIIETKWLVETRAESLGADIRKLYLEAAGQWPLEPKEWNAAATKEVVARLGTVKSYLIERLLPFLTKDVNSGGK
jgi:hypothetical protein